METDEKIEQDAITGTVGRFEGATGTFTAEASVLNGAFTETLTGDFD